MESKVSLQFCPDYDPANIESALLKALKNMPGWDSALKPGSKVLIKPNLLSAKVPEEHVTTHPEVLRSVIRVFKKNNNKIYVGDSPGGYGKNTEEVFEKTLTKKICIEEGVELVRFDKIRKVNGIPLASKLFECDYLVSVPKFKTHTVTTITAGVKNSFGLVPGLYKPQSHGIYPTLAGFCNFLVDVYSARLPDLVVLDAVTCMEGDGPNNGPLRNLDLIAVSNDGVSLDAVMAKIIGINSFDVLTTRLAHSRQVGIGEIKDIEITGDGIGAFKKSDYKLPFISQSILKPLLKPIFKYCKFKPYVDRSICTKCNICKNSCPVNAIDEKHNIDHNKCILCLCCHEFCPSKAVKIKRNLMAKIVWG